MAAGLLASLSGCSDSGKLNVYPTTGTLSMDGQPFGPTAIHLLPMEEEGRMVVGEVDANGKITFTSYEKGDGAPAGKYRVLTGMVMAAPPRPFPAIYQDASQSPLVATVEETEQNDLKIDMDSKAGPMVRPVSFSKMSSAQGDLMNPTPEGSE